VLAPADGVVIWAGTIVDRGVVAIDHGSGVRSSFEPVTPLVRRGDAVHRGERIGTAATGGTHPAGVLHIGARIHGEYVSPLLLLGGLQRAVLLPSTTAMSGGAPAGSSR
jgi:murein DD-endopeptidase MepM/ murein hydrolase activator NlpD